MKALFSICLIFAAAFVNAAEKPAVAPPAASVVKGEVLEVLDAESFTYFRLKTKDGEVWSAVSKAPIKVGSQVTVENATAMKDFKSKSLNRTFPLVMLGNLPGTVAGAPVAGDSMAAAHAGVGAQKVDVANVKVAKAKGANAKTVAEVLTKSAELKDKPVLVRGKIVKYNEGIMGKNWLHLRDGSGTDADKTNDILVTTLNDAKLGDVVTVKGVVHLDKDFGSGYAYKVLIEEATLQK
jgi:hypothetical protein